MKIKKIILLTVSVFMLMIFIPFQAMAGSSETVFVSVDNSNHRDEYTIINEDEVEIEDSEMVTIGTKLKIVPNTEVAPEGYVINSFWLYYSEDGRYEKIAGDSFIVTEDVEIFDVELSYVVDEADGDIWVYNNDFYLWDSEDKDNNVIDSYDFLNFYDSDDFNLEPHTMDYFHTITSKGKPINRNIYVVRCEDADDSNYYNYSGIYSGDLNLGTGGVYGYSYIYDEVYTYYPSIYILKGKLSANEIIGSNYIWFGVYEDSENEWIGESVTVYIKNDIVASNYEIYSYGATITVDGDITAPDVYFDSDYSDLSVTVGGSVNAIWFAQAGGNVNVKNNIIVDLDHNEELFGGLLDEYSFNYESHILIMAEYAHSNPTKLIVGGNMTAGENIKFGDDYYENNNNNYSMNSLNMADKSADKPGKNKGIESDKSMMLAYRKKDPTPYIEVYVEGDIEAGMEVNIYNGAVIAGGSIRTTNEESDRTIYIYGGNVECNEMYSTTDIYIYDNPIGTNIDVSDGMTAEYGIFMMRNPSLYDDPGFAQVNVGGVMSGEIVIIGIEDLEDMENDLDYLDIPMFIEVNAGSIESDDRINVFAGLPWDEMGIPQHLISVNLVDSMTATYGIELINSEINAGGSISAESTEDEGANVAIVSSIVKCGRVFSAGEVFIGNFYGGDKARASVYDYDGSYPETLVYINGDLTAVSDIAILGGNVYAEEIFAGNEIHIEDNATLFDAVNESDGITPNNSRYYLVRTKLSGLVPNATVKIYIYNDLYNDNYNKGVYIVKSFTTDADEDGNIYVWLLGDEDEETEGTAYYGEIEALTASPTPADGTEIEFNKNDAKFAKISFDVPDAIFIESTDPWYNYEEEDHPLNPANWIFTADGNELNGFSENSEDYTLVFTRNGQIYDIKGYLAGDYKVTISTEQEIGGDTYIAIGTAEFTIKPWIIKIKADDKKVKLGSEIDDDIFTISCSDNAGLVETIEDVGFLGEFQAICFGNTDKVGTYPIYVRPIDTDTYSFLTLMMKFLYDDSLQVELKKGTFTVYKASSPSRGSSSSTTYYTITASAGEGGTISPDNSVRVERGNNITFEIKPDEGYFIKDVLVNGKSVGDVQTYTFENVTEKAVIEAIFSPVEQEKWENPFDDVDENDWFYDAVEFCVKKGIFTGMTQDTFQPDTPVTRAMFVTLLGRLSGIDPEDYKSQVFDDVEGGQWYSPYIQWAYEKGIVKGYDEKTFGPNDTITREQMCSIIVRYCEFAGLDLKDIVEEALYDDYDFISSWAKVYVRKLQMADLIKGVGNNMFNPLGKASRAEAAAILMRLIQNVIQR